MEINTLIPDAACNSNLQGTNFMEYFSSKSFKLIVGETPNCYQQLWFTNPSPFGMLHRLRVVRFDKTGTLNHSEVCRTYGDSRENSVLIALALVFYYSVANTIYPIRSVFCGL